MSISRVLLHLCICDYESARDRLTLVKYGIRRIVSVTNDSRDLPQSELCQSLGIGTRVFPIADKSFIDEEEVLVEDLFPWVREAEESGETVLVHCQAGISRSPSFVITYLMWNGMTIENALKIVIGKHPDAWPWLDTLGAFLVCIGASVPDEHKDVSGPRARLKRFAAS